MPTITYENIEEARSAYARLRQYLIEHEALNEWMYSREAIHAYGIPKSTIGKACRNGEIEGVQLEAGDYKFPVWAFWKWRNRDVKRGRPKQTKEKVWAKALGMTKEEVRQL